MSAQQPLPAASCRHGTPLEPWEREAIVQLYPVASAQELATALRRSTKSVYAYAKQAGVKKSPQWIAERARANAKRPQHGSERTRFKPGQVPMNKGVKRPKGWAPGNMSSTLFKRGRPAHEARNYRPIGSVRLCCYGYLEQKVSDDPQLKPACRWTAVHRLVWVASGREIPQGHIVVFKPGQRTTVLEQITVDRLECISRVENMRRNTLHNRYPKDVCQLIQTRGALSRLINRRSQREKQDSGRA